ncbi:H-2 class II histocompatibility antigen, E-S beta chain-like [Mixophyes fleayi]|uniref:H-2 class II histocompatibility antigen, E-S beta chain-like n=1 Tax=Mixophyes fleayi TaxID=3061075 RepID=UPI003F4DB7E9
MQFTPEAFEADLDAADYMIEIKAECHYNNGTQNVRYLQRLFYNQQEFAYYDSDVGYYIPKTEFGRPDVEYWNKDKHHLADRRGAIERFCKPCFEAWENIGAIGRRVEPSVTVSLMPQHEGSDTEQHMLMCTVFDFFPSAIKVKWYRNGQEEIEQVQATELYQNGDWTFQIHVMLETDIQKGDTFACEVHHSSLKTPKRVTWHPETSDSARHKQVTGIVGFVLGAVFIIVGLVIYIRGQKVQTSFRGPQCEHYAGCLLFVYSFPVVLDAVGEILKKFPSILLCYFGLSFSVVLAPFLEVCSCYMAAVSVLLIRVVDEVFRV